MEYSGLLSKYPVNRPLTKLDKEFHLKQTERLDIKTTDWYSVIRINSNYMELVDKYFAWKGFLTMLCMVIVGMFAIGLFAIIHMMLFKVTPNSVADKAIIIISSIAILSPVIWFFTKEGLHDSFTYTHYPIILNRKTRMVHVFKVDGTVLSAEWDKVYFCLAALKRNAWEIQGHVLADDGDTVLDTFSFSPNMTSGHYRDKLKPHWEFIRRYMEEGPAVVSEGEQVLGRGIEFCLPITNQYEPFWCAFHRMWASYGLLMSILINVICYPGRYLAMITSKIPQWPADIAAQNIIPENDPYLRDETTHPWDAKERAEAQAKGKTYVPPTPIEENTVMMVMVVVFWVGLLLAWLFTLVSQ